MKKNSGKSPAKELVKLKKESELSLVSLRGLRDLAVREANLVQESLHRDHLGDIIQLTKSVHDSGKINVSEYIKRNTEILLNEHATSVRQKVLREMQQLMRDMSREVASESQRLQKDVDNFFDFIKCNYEMAANTFSSVLELAKSNNQKMNLIQEYEQQLFDQRSELEDLEQQLLECLMCTAFLMPRDCEENEKRLLKSLLKSFGPSCSIEDGKKIQKQTVEDLINQKITISSIPACLDVSPEDIHQMLNRIKDSNLSLIQSTERADQLQRPTPRSVEVSEWEGKIRQAEYEYERAAQNTEALKEHISELERVAAANNEERSAQRTKLQELYRLCTGSSTAQVDDLPLIQSAIGCYIDGLLQEIQLYPKRKVRELFRTLETEKKTSGRTRTKK